jgi:hypothetical protein
VRGNGSFPMLAFFLPQGRLIAFEKEHRDFFGRYPALAHVSSKVDQAQISLGFPWYWTRGHRFETGRPTVQK